MTCYSSGGIVTVPVYVSWDAEMLPSRVVLKRQNDCSFAPEHPLGTPWAESGIPFDESDVHHSSYPAVSSQILFTTTI